MNQTLSRALPVVAIVVGILLIVIGAFAYAPLCTADGACASPNLRTALPYIVAGLLLGVSGFVFNRQY